MEGVNNTKIPTTKMNDEKGKEEKRETSHTVGRETKKSTEFWKMNFPAGYLEWSNEG